MVTKLFILFLLLTTSLYAKMLISPHEAMKASFGEESVITKHNKLLRNAQAKTISQNAKVKLKSKIFRIFKATKNDQVVGYGVLINKKVRSKNAVVLYLISNDAILKGIEVIAFNEPIEYLPSKTWNSQFENVPTSKMLKISRNIPTITGATLSARSITDGSRVAFAFYNEMLKDK